MEGWPLLRVLPHAAEPRQGGVEHVVVMIVLYDWNETRKEGNQRHVPGAQMLAQQVRPDWTGLLVDLLDALQHRLQRLLLAFLLRGVPVHEEAVDGPHVQLAQHQIHAGLFVGRSAVESAVRRELLEDVLHHHQRFGHDLALIPHHRHGAIGTQVLREPVWLGGADVRVQILHIVLRVQFVERDPRAVRERADSVAQQADALAVRRRDRADVGLLHLATALVGYSKGRSGRSHLARQGKGAKV
mmetsp:Transcript_5990/g.23262  ORF Transcript_5990/g.23262 Transcript_5990/m.23262 type:complete len:243 (-) Transcript_5990:32-760(-)